MVGGADILLIETIFDTLNAKAALFAVQEAYDAAELQICHHDFGHHHRCLRPHPERANHRGVFDLDEPHAALQHWAELCVGGRAIDAVPRSAGEPRHVPGQRLPQCRIAQRDGRIRPGPEAMAEAVRPFLERGWINVIGGCCGTTLTTSAPSPRSLLNTRRVPSRKCPRLMSSSPATLQLAGLEPLIVTAETNFVNIGERTNVTGGLQVCPPHPGGKLRGSAGHRPRTSRRRRPNHRRQHGRRPD